MAQRYLSKAIYSRVLCTQGHTPTKERNREHQTHEGRLISAQHYSPDRVEGIQVRLSPKERSSGNINKTTANGIPTVANRRTS